MVLYERDADSGKLKKLDSVSRDPQGLKGLDFAIRVRFSPDGKQVYVRDGERGGITTFELLDGGKFG